MLIIIYRLDNLFFNKISFIEEIKKIQNEIKKKELKMIINDTTWEKPRQALVGIAAKKIRILLATFQKGGGCIYPRGLGLDWGSKKDPNNFVNFFYTWGGNYNSNLQVKYYHCENPNYLDEKYIFDKNKNKFEKNILYSPTSLSSLFDIQCTLALRSGNMNLQRNFTEKIISKLDNFNKDITINLFIKIKNFGSTIFENYEWMFFHKPKLKHINVYYILEGTSEEYFKYVDLHIFDGPSTSLANSLNYNIPFICIWNEKILSTQKQYNRIFYDLKKIGAICTNESTFKNSLNNFLLNTEKTWFNTKVKKIKKRASKILARTSVFCYQTIQKNLSKNILIK